MTVSKFRIAGALAAILLAGTALAQTVPDQDGAPGAGLNLPGNLTFFSAPDPNVRKATAIVNGELITGTDVDQRLALVVSSNGGRVEEEEKERLRLQVLRNLIDETLQIQEARANDITIEPREVDSSFGRVSRNFRQTPQAFGEYLRTIGSSERSLKRQIQGELAWQRLLSRNAQVNVSDGEVQAQIDRLNRDRGTPEYRLGEIFISATAETAPAADANARRIMEQLRQGASFPAYARQFSEASTAAVGGDLGWIRGAQLPQPLAEAAQQMQVGQLVGPIAVPGGVSILLKLDQRAVLTADPRDATLSLRQLSLPFARGISPAEAQRKAASFGEALRTLQGCGRVNQLAQELGAEVVDNDAVRVRDLPPQLQELMLNLQIGQSTPPFGSPEEGVRALVLCGRDDAKAANEPSFEQVMGQIEEERVNRRAQRYLRDLRRDAVVDYR